uniref:Macro domain-containing protein n=1 Tax=Steinernema glaseri TaxID=37863 RepID=A0A1I8AWS4_9BILA
MAAVNFRPDRRKHIFFEGVFENCSSGRRKAERSREYLSIASHIESKTKEHFEHLYENVIDDIFEYISSFDGVLIPAAVLRCGYIDNSQLWSAIQDSRKPEKIYQFFVVSPATASRSVCECVYDLLEKFNKKTLRRKYSMLIQ